MLPDIQVAESCIRRVGTRLECQSVCNSLVSTRAGVDTFSEACADKISNEIKMFGKNFEGYREDEQEDESASKTEITSKTDVTKFSAKKTKAVMKSGGKTKCKFPSIHSPPLRGGMSLGALRYLLGIHSLNSSIKLSRQASVNLRSG